MSGQKQHFVKPDSFFSSSLARQHQEGAVEVEGPRVSLEEAAAAAEFLQKPREVVEGEVEVEGHRVFLGEGEEAAAAAAEFLQRIQEVVVEVEVVAAGVHQQNLEAEEEGVVVVGVHQISQGLKMEEVEEAEGAPMMTRPPSQFHPHPGFQP